MSQNNELNKAALEIDMYKRYKDLPLVPIAHYLRIYTQFTYEH